MRKEYRATARGKARMKEAQRKYRDTPQSKQKARYYNAEWYARNAQRKLSLIHI